MIGAGVATSDMTDDELEERANYLMRGMYVFAEAMAPALSMEHDSTARIFHRFADFADAIEEKGSVHD